MFCTKLKLRIRKLLSQFDNLLESNIDTALHITRQLKQFLVSPVADILTAIIPGNIDEIIRRQLIYTIDKVIEGLFIADSCREFKSTADKLKCFAMHLQQAEPHLKDAILQKMASLLAAELDGNRLKQSVYDLYTQAKFSVDKV